MPYLPNFIKNRRNNSEPEELRQAVETAIVKIDENSIQDSGTMNAVEELFEAMVAAVMESDVKCETEFHKFYEYENMNEFLKSKFVSNDLEGLKKNINNTIEISSEPRPRSDDFKHAAF